MLPVCIILCILVPYNNAQVDLTRVHEAAGTDVVLATISLIQRSGTFSDDNRLLRRVAHIESGDGLDEDTFREGYNGGIWQVDEAIFQKTRNMTLLHQGIYERLLMDLGVDWSIVMWEDLRTPLISALAARLFFKTVEENIPIVGQAEFWKSSGFNTNDEDTVEFFTQSITELELKGIIIHPMISAWLLNTLMVVSLWLYASLPLM